MMNQIAKRLMLAGMLSAVGLCAQAPAEFVVASIKPAAPMENGRMMIGMRGGPGTPSPGQMTFTNVSLAQIMQRAYDVKSYQISGPDWMSSARFDISAKVPAGAKRRSPMSCCGISLPIDSSWFCIIRRKSRRSMCCWLRRAGRS